MNPLLFFSQDSLATEAASNPVLGGIGPFLVGIVIAAVLVGVVPWAIRRHRTQPRRPRPSEQPVRPAGRTHIAEHREPDGESFPDDGSRLSPHQLKSHSSHPGPGRRRPREEQGGGSSGG
ncbi:hypothetical protein HHX38_23210 [Streptomyces sp. PKU-MA01144]|uniref:DUF6479 family protein n=1 Tax=Streptomyces TaxID=1883 RepID=UPI00147B6DDA|nr:MULTISPECIES: DUF6479 family protein [Streptomyces]MCY0981164.1 DUF6479 family protein [Streptomyces tirandamycinicus]NNJ07012.1 hypothetical protein [Streptomyces sp. PKU-MA01144]